MLAGTLSDAVNRMRLELGRSPKLPLERRERVERLLGEMDEVRRELDAPPTRKRWTRALARTA